MFLFFKSTLYCAPGRAVDGRRGGRGGLGGRGGRAGGRAGGEARPGRWPAAGGGGGGGGGGRVGGGGRGEGPGEGAGERKKKKKKIDTQFNSCILAALRGGAPFSQISGQAMP